MKDSPHLKLPRGIDALRPVEAAVHRRLESDWFGDASLYGHRAVHLPPVGFAETFTYGHEAAGERTYVFADRAGRSMALVSDSGAAILRLALESRAIEQRLSFDCPIFRYWRRPHRYLHHLGASTYVPRRPSQAGAAQRVEELLQLVGSFLAPRVPAKIRVTDMGIRRGLLAPTAHRMEAPPSKLLQDYAGLAPADRAGWLEAREVPPSDRAAIEALDAVGQRDPSDPALDDLSRRMPDDLRPRLDLARALAAAGRTPEVLAAGLEVVVDLDNVHGAEFHDGLAYEIVHPNGDRLGDGGDFSAYAAKFADADVGMFSTVIVPERIVPRLAALRTEPEVYLRVGSEARAVGASLAAELRGRRIRTWVDGDDDKLKRQVRDAVARGCRYVVVVGGRELQSGRVRVHRVDGADVEVPVGDVASWLAAEIESG